MIENKSNILKNVLINLGVLLILVDSTTTRGDLAYFFLALAILAIQTIEFSCVQAKKLVVAGVMLSATIATAAYSRMSPWNSML
jgi:hypothetical protein